MIFSQELLFSDHQAITTTDTSDNTIDLGTTGTALKGPSPLVRDIGKGKPVPILVQVTEDFANLTSLTITLEVDSDVNFGSAKTVYSSGAIPVADLVAGYKLPIIYVPTGVDERYLRLNYTVGGSAANSGEITAGIVLAVQTNDTVAGA